MFVKRYGFFSFAKNFGKNIGKSINNENIVKNIFDHAKQSATDTFKIAFERTIQKTT